MTPKEIADIQRALDGLGSALTRHRHQWTAAEKRAYGRACAILKRKRRAAEGGYLYPAELSMRLRRAMKPITFRTPRRAA